VDVPKSKGDGRMEAFSLKSKNLLKSEDVERFPQARTHPVFPKRFGNIDCSRISDLAQLIRILLNFGFRYDRVSPFLEVFKIHKMMSFTQEEVFAFHDLFLKVCCLDLKLSVQRRAMNRIGTLIFQGNLKTVSTNYVLFLYRSFRTNPILRHRFEDVTPNQVDQILDRFLAILKPGVKEEEFQKFALMDHYLYLSKLEHDEFTKFFLQRYQNENDFVANAKPIIWKLRGYMIMDYADQVMKLYNRFKTNPVLSVRLSIHEPSQTRAMISLMLELVKDPSYLDQMENVAELHLDLKITEEGFVQFELVFLEVCIK